jgi:hypothetical protein
VTIIGIDEAGPHVIDGLMLMRAYDDDTADIRTFLENPPSGGVTVLHGPNVGLCGWV